MKTEATKNILVVVILAICVLAFPQFLRAEEDINFEVPAPGQSEVLEKQEGAPMISSKAKTITYLSKLDQNTIENQYKVFFQENGFKFRKDKEVRIGTGRRLRFDKEGLVVDINLVNMNASGTHVLIMKYLASEAQADLKDLASIDTSKIELPDYRGNREQFKVESFKEQPEGVTGYSSGSGLGLNIPLAPDSELLDDKPTKYLTGNDGEGFVYYSKTSPKEVESFYQAFFSKQGFRPQPDMDIRMANVRRVRFEAKDLTVDIYLSNRDTGCNVTVIKYPGPNGAAPVEKNPFAILTLPKEDNAAGSDLDNIPRPGKSVRTMSQTSGKKTNLSYIVAMTVAETNDFYLKQMPNFGWSLTRQMNIGKVSDNYARKNNKPGLIPNIQISENIDIGDIIKNCYLLDFKSESAEARVTIYPNFTDQKAGSMVDILYNRN